MIMDTLNSQYDGLTVFVMLMVMSMMFLTVGFVSGFIIGRQDVSPAPPAPPSVIEIDMSSRSRGGVQVRRIPVRVGGEIVDYIEMPPLEFGAMVPLDDDGD